jgi:prepilin peptidase CpaA
MEYAGGFVFTRAIVLVFFLSICTISDVKHRRIDNKTVLVFLFAGLCMGTYCHGLAGISDSLLGAMVAFLFIPFFLAGMFGAGDLKLLIAAGCVSGVSASVNGIILALVMEAVIGFVALLYKKMFFKVILNLFSYFKDFCLTGIVKRYDQSEYGKDSIRFPFYSIGMLIGIFYFA